MSVTVPTHSVGLSSSDRFRLLLLLSPAALTFRQVKRRHNHKEACRDRLHIHDINPACVFSCIHQAVLFHCHHNTTLIAEINTVMRTLMDVSSTHLIPNCEGGRGGLWAALIQSERRNDTLWMLSFYYDAGFLEFSLLGWWCPVRTFRLWGTITWPGGKSCETPFDSFLCTFQTVFVHKTVEYHHFYVKINFLNLVLCESAYYFMLCTCDSAVKVTKGSPSQRHPAFLLTP